MNRLFETSSEELVDDGNNLYLCGMKKLLCPQCKIAAMYVKNEQGERLLVYVLENGEVVPKYPEDSMEGFDLTEVFCLERKRVHAKSAQYIVTSLSCANECDR